MRMAAHNLAAFAAKLPLRVLSGQNAKARVRRRPKPFCSWLRVSVEPKCRVVLADLTTSDRHLVNLVGPIGDTKGTDMGVHVR